MMQLVRGGLAGAVLTGMVMFAPGCGAKLDPLLPPDAFVNRRPGVGPDSGNPVDRPGPLAYDAQHEPTRKPSGDPTIPTDVVQAAQTPISAPPPRDTVAATTQAQTQASANGVDAGLPTTSPTGVSVDQYQLVGSVLATVNGQPIYADKVLARLERDLAAAARKYNSDDFKLYAARDVQSEIDAQENAEVEFAAAKVGTKKEDQDLAQMLTTKWRQEQITVAGGSEAVARQRMAAEGVDFEELCREKYRYLLLMIYWQRKVKPLIDVSAQDIRRYYDDPENRRKYTVSAAARYRVIKIDYAKYETRALAVAKAKQLIDNAASGEDFSALASQYNDDPYLKSHKGAIGDDTGWMERGAYAIPGVDAAVWDLKAGQVSPKPIETEVACYIVKLEALRPEVVKSFSEVQAAIENILERQQTDKMVAKYRERLRSQRVVVENGDVVQTMMEVVMQRYSHWAGKQ